MSWLNLNQSLSGLKGQFKNLANEVFSEGIVEDTDPFTEVSAANDKIKELQSLAASQDAEIKTLRRQNATLHQDKLNSISKDNGTGSKSFKEPPPENEEETSWFWDPPDAEASTPSKSSKTDENRRLSALVTSLQAEISNLKIKIETTKKSDNNEGLSPIGNNSAEEVIELREQLELLKHENVTLTTNLEDLDSQHQTAIEEVMKLKRELQVNYEILQKKNESLEKDIADYKTRLKNIETEEAASFKDLSDTNLNLISDLDIMHHKFDNLERVHRMLTENTEKFQEENQELSEENFRLQEDYARMQHDMEQLQNKSQLSVKSNENHVPNEKYRELEDKNLDLERKLAELVPKKAKDGGLDNILDSNAQEVIAKLKFEIVELQNKLNTNEEIKRLNLEIDHLRKEVDSLSTQQTENFISCESIRKVIDKYMAPDFPAIQKYLKNSSTELLEYTDMCLKNYADLRSKNETLESRASEDSRIINNLQANIDEMNAEIDILNGDLSHYSHECSEQKKNNDFLIAEIGALKSVSKLEPILEHNNEEHMEKLQTELDDCSNLNKNIEAELEKYENQLLEAETEKNKVVSELNSIREELKLAKNEIDLLKKAQNDSVDDESLSILQKKLADTQNELDKTKTQLHSVSVENEKNKIDLTIVDNDKVLLMREISELKANIQTKAIIEDYAKKIEAEKTDLEIKLCRLSEMETMVETLNKKNDYLKERIARLDAMVASSAMTLTQEVIIHKNKEMRTNKTFKEKEQELQKAQQKIVALETTPNMAVLLDVKKELEECSTKLADFNGPYLSPSPSVSETKKDAVYVEILVEDGLKNAAKSLISNVEILKQSVLKDRDSTFESLKAELGQSNAELEESKMAYEGLKLISIDKKTLEAKVKKMTAEATERQKDIDSFDEQYNKLFEELTRVKQERDDMNERATEILSLVDEKDKEIVTKVVEIEMLKEEIKEIDAEFTKVKEQKHKLCLEKDILRNQNLEIEKSNEKIIENEKTIATLNAKIVRLETEMEYIRVQNIGKLAEAKSKAAESPQVKEELLRLKTDYDSIENQKLEADIQIQTLSTALSELETKMKSLTMEEEVRLDELKQLGSHKAEAEVQIQQLNTEKNELINLVTQKHQESITYHAEIQRLNAVLFTESDKYKKLERLTEQLKATAQDTSRTDLESSSQDVEHLTTVLREKTDRCLQLEGILNEIRKAGITPDELEKLREKNQFLVEKCEIMGNNLVMEQANARQIVQEKIQIVEKEQAMSRELERLRQHLLDMEEEQTKELVAAEQRWQEAQAKLTSAEEKVKHSSTMYTSNSIRANQEVETLRTQIKLVEKQRDEIQAHLSQSEDRNSKNLAALTNLQCVLEQFQMDKERDGEAVAGRARRDLISAREEIQRLQHQILDIEEKLRDSNSGLRAAARLSGQLEARAAQVQEAREIAAKLEEELSQWKKKYRDAVSNQQDKVDKSLVKNLLMGYINTVNQRQGDRIQVLRLLSTVLDFDQTECERAGLGRATVPGMPGHGGSDSLAQEFIKFLEKESQPQLKVGLPNLLHLGQAQGPNSPNLSTKSDSPSSISSQQVRSTSSPFQTQSTQPQQSTQSAKPVVPIVVPLAIDNPIITNANSNSPVTVSSTYSDTGVNTAAGNAVFNMGGFSLFTPIANPDLVVNQTRNSEGAILKNVLKDA